MSRAGVILAAGFGSRLSDGIKPMTPVGGIPMLLRALRGLQVAGCAPLVVVGGHAADELEGWLADRWPDELRFVRNPRYELQNGLSLLAARDHLPGEFVLAMADHVVEDAIMRQAGAHELAPRSATLLVDYKLDAILDLEDATKVTVERGRVKLIGKTLERFDAVDCGVFVAGPAFLSALQEVEAERGDASLTEGAQRLADAGRMRALDVGGAFWQDVDTPAMLAHAERYFG